MQPSSKACDAECHIYMRGVCMMGMVASTSIQAGTLQSDWCGNMRDRLASVQLGKLGREVR